MQQRKPLVAIVDWLRSFGLAVACLVVVVAVCPAAGSDETDIPPARFLTALDLEGTPHHIGSGEGYKALALVFMTTECPISREYVPELNRLANSIEGQPIKFLGVLSEPGLTRANAVKFQKEFNIEFPVLFDASGELTAALRPTHVPEAFVLNTDSHVVYRGRIDDRYGDLGKKRPEPTTHELADAMTAVAAGQPVSVEETKPIGCPIEPVRPATSSK